MAKKDKRPTGKQYYTNSATPMIKLLSHWQSLHLLTFIFLNIHTYSIKGSHFVSSTLRQLNKLNKNTKSIQQKISRIYKKCASQFMFWRNV